MRVSRQRRRDGEPEADEERQRLGPDRDVALQPLHLARQAIEPPGESGFFSVGTVRRQKRDERRLDNGGAGDFLAIGQIDQLPQDFRGKYTLVRILIPSPHSAMPSSGSMEACRATLRTRRRIAADRTAISSG
jgi:hypothetical protein